MLEITEYFAGKFDLIDLSRLKGLAGSIGADERQVATKSLELANVYTNRIYYIHVKYSKKSAGDFASGRY